MAKGIRALLDTVMQALPQVGNLGLLFFLLFFIFAALGVELFGRLRKCFVICLPSIVQDEPLLQSVPKRILVTASENTLISKRSAWLSLLYSVLPPETTGTVS